MKQKDAKRRALKLFNQLNRTFSKQEVNFNTYSHCYEVEIYLENDVSLHRIKRDILPLYDDPYLKTKEDWNELTHDTCLTIEVGFSVYS